MPNEELKDGFYWVKPHKGAAWAPAEYSQGAFRIPGHTDAVDVLQVGPILVPPPGEETWNGNLIAFADEKHPLRKASDAWVTFNLAGAGQAVNVIHHRTREAAKNYALSTGKMYGRVDALCIKHFGKPV